MTNPPSSYLTWVISTCGITRMPSRAKTSATSGLTSGSSLARIRSAASSMVTRTPNLAKTWASSAPIVPAPMTASDEGSSVTCMTCRLFQYGVSARPGIGGTDGAAPGATTTARRARKTSPSTSTVRGPVTVPWPRTTRAPRRSSAATFFESSQSLVATVRMCSATGAHEGSTVALPARSFTRRASTREYAARDITLDGTQP